MRNKLIFFGLALVLAAGGYLAITRWQPKQSEPASPPSKGIINIYQVAASSIASIHINTADHTYNLTKQEDIWQVANQPNVELIQPAIATIVTHFSMLNAMEQLPTGTPLAEYGLDKPLGTPTITLQDGTTVAFVVGNPTPIGTGYYFKRADSDQVYIIAAEKAKAFLAPLADYRTRTLFSTTVEQVASVTIRRKDMEIALRQKTEQEITQSTTFSESGWVMTAPYHKDVALDVLSARIVDALAFVVVNFVDDNPSDYAKYGLDQPQASVEITNKDKTSALVFVGKETENGYYAQVEGKPNVYEISKSSVTYKDIDPVTLLEPLVYVPAIDKVNQMVVRVDGVTKTLTIQHGEQERTYAIDGQSVTKEKFIKIYQTIIAVSLRDVVTTQPTGSPLCTIQTTYNNGSGDDTITFYSYGDRFAAVSINGTAQFVVPKEQVEAIIAIIKDA